MSSPKVDLMAPFTYQVTVASRAGGRDRISVVRDWAKVEVPDLTGDDAPIVARLHLEYRVAGKKLRDADRIAIDIRHHGGRFLEPVMVPGASYTPMTTARYATIAAKRNTVLGNLAWPGSQHMGAFDAVTRESLPADATDNRESCLASLRGMASSGAFVDGIFHKVSSEPVYVRSQAGIVTSELLKTAKGRVEASRIFRADDEDLILNFVSKLPGKMQSGQLDKNMIEVFDASVLTWSRRDGMAIDAARMLVERMSRELVRAPSSTVLHWLDVRDALAAGSMETPELVEVTETLLAMGVEAGLTRSTSSQVRTWLDTVIRSTPDETERMSP